MQRLFSILGLITLVSACGNAQDASTTHDDATVAAASGSVLPGTFKLYPTPNKKPNVGCDLFTSLTLVNGTVAPVAILQAKVDGTCEIAVNAAERVYTLTAADASCGSTLFTGDGIEILDHRARTCRDIVEAEIIVTETDGNRVQRLYSTMHHVADVSLEGRLTQIMGIGGESTGHGIETADGRIIEIDLATGGFAASFVEGQSVQLAGYQKTVAGVEIPHRNVLVVTELTLL